MNWKLLFLVLPSLLLAEKAGVKVDGIDSQKDTTITIKKGVKADLQCVEYEILEGSEDITGSSEFDRTKARADWKVVCKEWRDNLKELNKANSLINLSCGAPFLVKEEENKYAYKSKGIYKVKVRIREKAVDAQ